MMQMFMIYRAESQQKIIDAPEAHRSLCLPATA
jgi:hypothetical protein